MMFVWRILAFVVWFGVAFALATIVVAVALVFIVGVVGTGLVMPSRTINGQLRSLDFNTRAAIAQVKALNPR